MKPDEILKDQASFTKYWYSFLRLSDNFIALDTNSTRIEKEKFLEKVMTGHFLPLRLTSEDTSVYKLYKINSQSDTLINIWLKDIGAGNLKYYRWEGKQLPIANFSDLNGMDYNQDKLKGKLFIIDFWFIGCRSCVQAMPELNRIVDNYKNRRNILFFGFAFDKKKELEKFLEKTDYHFTVISDTASSLAKKIGIVAYPTYLVVDRNFNIVKLIDGYHDLEILKELISKYEE